MIRAFDDEAWRAFGQQLRQRVAKLAGCLNLRIVPVTESDIRSGDVKGVRWIVTPRCRGLLSDELAGDKTRTVSRAHITECAVAALEAVLEALCALHARDLCHGDIRPRNVGFDDLAPGRREYFLIDAAIGPISHWTGGERIDDAQRSYLPPEADGKIGSVLSREADMYAAGLTFAESLGIWKPGQDVEDASRQPAWKRRVPPGYRGLLRGLLAEDPQQRPSASVAAKRRRHACVAKQAERWRLAACIAAGLCVVSVIAALTSATRLEFQYDETRRKLINDEETSKAAKEDHQSAMRDLKNEHVRLATDVLQDPGINALRPESIKKLEELSGNDRAGPPEGLSEARQRLRDWFRDSEITFKQIRAEVRKISTNGLDGKMRDILLDWDDRAERQKQWWVRITIKAPKETKDLLLTVNVVGVPNIHKFPWPFTNGLNERTKDFQLTWKPDQPIRILLEIPGTIYDKNVLDQTVTGGLSLYKLQLKGVAANEYQVDLELVDKNGHALADVPK